MDERDSATATANLMTAITDIETHLQMLAQANPQVLAIGGIAFGQIVGPLVITHHIDDDGGLIAHCSPIALERAKRLAQFVASLPDDLVTAFKLTFELELIGLERGRRQAGREH